MSTSRLPGSRMACLLLLLVAAVASPEGSRGAPEGRHADKVLHALAGASVALVGGSIAVAAMKSRDVQQAGAVLAVAGVGSAALLGVTKELLDLAGLGDPEWLDLACTILGGLVVSAGACALLVDELPRGLEPAELAPPFLAFGIVLSLPVTHAWFSSRHVRGSP